MRVLPNGPGGFRRPSRPRRPGHPGPRSDPTEAAHLSLSKIRSALKTAGRQRNIDSRAQQIRAALRTEQFTAPAAVAATSRAAVGIITELNRQIADLEAELATHFQTHSDADVYLSPPGLGVVLGARVLGQFGNDPNHYTDVKPRKNYARTSPLTVASGKKRAVLGGHVRNRRPLLRHRPMGLLRLNNSPGARAFYDQYRTDGDTHHQPLRGPPATAAHRRRFRGSRHSRCRRRDTRAGPVPVAPTTCRHPTSR